MLKSWQAFLLKGNFIQEWNAKISQSSKGRNNHIFKVTVEKVILTLYQNKSIYTTYKFRTSNHTLLVEVGRWENISYADRKCSLCKKQDIGDEFHYLLICTFFRQTDIL